MARNGSGVYSLPAGSVVANGDTSDATDVNTPIADIAADLNTARPIVAGGTGATSASAARTALGVQAYDAALTSIAALGTAADKMLYSTGVDTFAETDLTAAGRALLDDADAAAQRTTLGLGTSAVAALIDDDTMATATATNIASAESTKSYVDASLIPTPGDVGSYVWAYYTTNSNVTFGTTVAGSSLKPTSGVYKGTNFASSHGTSTFASGSALSGTWACCGYSDYVVGVNPTYYGATIWQRTV